MNKRAGARRLSPSHPSGLIAGHGLRPAFTLMEVLVALGLFAVGFVAVATIFPTGAYLQRGTSIDVQSRAAEKSAEAVIKATLLDDGKLMNLYFGGTTDNGDTQLKAFAKPPNNNASSSNNLNDTYWSLDTRSYPAAINGTFRRDYYWVPLLSDTKADKTKQVWQIVVFVLHREGGKTYSAQAYPDDDATNHTVPGLARKDISVNTSTPKTFTVDSGTVPLRPGDWVAVHGSWARVKAVTPPPSNGVAAASTVTVGSDITGANYVWYAPPADGRDENSPATRVFTIAGSDLNIQ